MRFVINKPNVSEGEAKSLLLSPREKISVDIETVSLENRLPLGIAIAVSPDSGFYFFNPEDELLGIIPQTPVVLFQNAKFDIPILKKLGWGIQHYEDTNILAYSAGILENSLNMLSQSILYRDCPSVTSQWRKKNQGNIGIDHVKLAGISIIHACNTYALWDKLPKIPLYYEIDKPCIELLIEMEEWGLTIDQYMLTQVEQATMVKALQLEQELKQELGQINLASNPQIVKALQSKGIIGTRKTKGGAESVSEESLRPLKNPLTDKLLEYRGEMKTITTYVPAFRNTDNNGRIHTDFGNTDTGRWKSSNPNLQNISRNDLRKCIVSPCGYSFICLDANQIELRVISILSQDPLLLEALKTEDLHMTTAIQVFGWTEDKEVMTKRRYNAKQGNFAIIYGADEFRIAELLGMSVPEAQEWLSVYFSKYKVLDRWIKSIKKQAKEDGYVVNMFGRIRPLPELSGGSWKIREKAEREAVNTICQGTAVDIVKKIMLYLKEILNPEVRLVLQVHDEILLEVPDRLVQETLKKSKELALVFPDYPVSISMGKCYGTLEKINNKKEEK